MNLIFYFLFSYIFSFFWLFLLSFFFFFNNIYFTKNDKIKIRSHASNQIYVHFFKFGEFLINDQNDKIFIKIKKNSIKIKN